MRSIQGRIILIFFALILLAMQFIGVYLLRSLEAHYLVVERDRRIDEAQVLANEVAAFLPLGEGDEATGAEGPGAPELQALLEEFNRGRYYVYVMVMDSNGAVIAASDPALIGQRTLQETAALQALAEASVRPYQRRDPDTGARHLGAAAPVLDADGVGLGAVVIEGDFSVIEQTLGDIRNILFTATAVVAAVAVLLAWIMSRTITGPIRAITERAAEMAAGDFEQQIEVPSQDELGRLAAMFNHLAQRLKETLDEIYTEKHKVEAILSHMADGVIAFDETGRLFMANPAARRMLGVDDPVGDYIFEHLELEELVGDDRQPGEPERGPRIIKRGDRSFSVYFARIPAVGSPGNAGTVCVLHDITELEQLEKLRKEFVANVSHELRTPLTTIKSYSETLLADDDIDSQIRSAFLQVIHDETDRMARLVSDLLDLSQLESQRASWDREYCRLSELAHQVLTKLQPQLEAKNLRTEAPGPGSSDPLVYVDPDRMQQVLMNVIANAVEFTPPGGLIRVAVEPGDSEVVVRISDTGVGIPAEDLPRLFDRFYRVDKARTREMGGTGLGLAIARQIVEGHGGRIQVESTPGKGTTVSFTVPYEQMDPPMDSVV